MIKSEKPAHKSFEFLSKNIIFQTMKFLDFLGIKFERKHLKLFFQNI